VVIPLDKPKSAICAVKSCGEVIDGISDEQITWLLRKHCKKTHPNEWRRLCAELAGIDDPRQMLRREGFTE